MWDTTVPTDKKTSSGSKDEKKDAGHESTTMYSMLMSDSAVYGIEPSLGNSFTFAGRDLKTGKVLFRELVAGYIQRPSSHLFPRLYGKYAVAVVQDSKDFELKVFDTATGKAVQTLKLKGTGIFGEAGRVSATVQNGRLIFLSKNDLFY